MKRTELRRKTPMPRGTVQLRRTAPITVAAVSLVQRSRLRPVSTKRAAENRQRAKVVKQLVEADPICAFPSCTAFASDPHEIVPRSRGGSIVDPEIIRLLCRPHHNWAHEHPIQATELGLLVHSWNRKGLPKR